MDFFVLCTGKALQGAVLMLLLKKEQKLQYKNLGNGTCFWWEQGCACITAGGMVVSQVGEADSRLSAAQALHNSLVLRTKLSACLSSPVMTGVAALCCLPSSFEVMALHAGKSQKPGSPGLWHQQSREEGPCSLFSGLLCCSHNCLPCPGRGWPWRCPR